MRQIDALFACQGKALYFMCRKSEFLEFYAEYSQT